MRGLRYSRGPAKSAASTVNPASAIAMAEVLRPRALVPISPSMISTGFCAPAGPEAKEAFQTV